jgi:threonine aldolase
VQTNMVFFNVRPEAGITAAELAERLYKKHRVQILDVGEYRFRAVLHYWISAENVDQVLGAIREELS